MSARYLVLPIQNEGENGKLRLQVDGKIVLDYDLALATGPESTDWYAFFSIERFKGKRRFWLRSICARRSGCAWHIPTMADRRLLTLKKTPS